jgi:CRP/FNR family transcriptional regulator
MKELKPTCDVNTCLLCRLCLKDWIPAVRANRKNFQLNKGEMLFKEGDIMNGIYFIYQGTVKVHKQWGEDKELILRFAKDGQIVGHRGFGKDDYFPVSATALERTTVCFLDKDFFLSSLKVNQNFLYELMMFFATELKESEKNMRNLAHMPVKGRIAQALFMLKEKFGTDDENDINIQLTRQDIASFVGTTYETLFRMINEMIEEGSIRSTGKKIGILDEQKLYSHIKSA